METKLNWTDISPDELSSDVQGAYDAYKVAYRTMKAAKLAFETAARGEIPAPEGFEVKFGYNFGKLGIALAPVTDKPKASAKPKQSLAAWIASQAASGARV